MTSPRIIAYTFNADMYCPCCTREAAANGNLVRRPPLECETDEHGIALDLVDRAGDRVMPVFSTDEIPDQGIDCTHCEREIEPEPMVEACFESGLVVRMKRAAARDIACPGRDAFPYCEMWLDDEDSGIDWDKLSADEIREAIASVGAWDEDELEDERENQLRLMWLAAGYASADGQF